MTSALPAPPDNANKERRPEGYLRVFHLHPPAYAGKKEKTAGKRTAASNILLARQNERPVLCYGNCMFKLGGIFAVERPGSPAVAIHF